MTEDESARKVAEWTRAVDVAQREIEARDVIRAWSPKNEAVAGVACEVA